MVNSKKKLLEGLVSFFFCFMFYCFFVGRFPWFDMEGLSFFLMAFG